MAQRSLKIIVVLMFFSLPIFLQGQKIFQQPSTVQQIVGNLNYDSQKRLYGRAPLMVKSELTGFGTVNNSRPLISLNYSWSLVRPSGYDFNMSPMIYNQTLGFFCEKELQLQKITNVPFHFRLGSLEYVNWMEQKPNAILPK